MNIFKSKNPIFTINYPGRNLAYYNLSEISVITESNDGIKIFLKNGVVSTESGLPKECIAKLFYCFKNQISGGN